MSGKKEYQFCKKIVNIAKKIDKANGRMYLVGGAVRDFLMNQKSNDEDYCVTGISKEEFQKMFPEAYLNGKEFPVFRIDEYEIALARKENKIGKKHIDFEIYINKNISIQEDLKRRDITVNAIALDVLSGKIIDPYEGIKDIKNKIIRAVSESFKEDPLRIYRVARFASKLDFDVDENTKNMMKSIKEELRNISEERVFLELRKTFNTKKPSKFFEILKEIDALNIHFKELKDLINVEQPIIYHPEGDAFSHTMKAIDEAVKLTNKEEYIYAVLVHDLGKGSTPKEKYPHHINHDINGVKLVRDLSDRLKVPNLWKECGEVAAKEHMRAGIFDKMRYAKQVDLINNLNKSKLGLEGMKIVVLCDRLSSNTENQNDVDFDKIGKIIISEINGEYIKEKFNLKEGIVIKEKIREERIKLLKILNKRNK